MEHWNVGTDGWNPRIEESNLLVREGNGAGEALLLLSRTHATWAVAFLVINVIYMPVFEEPQLRQRFGASYDAYCTHVPRLMPRLRPFTGEST